MAQSLKGSFNPQVLAGLSWGMTGLTYLAAEAIAARAYPGYSYVHNLISDLGQPSSPLAWVMNAGFIAEGLLYALALRLVFIHSKVEREFLVFGFLHVAGLVLIAIFHGGRSGLFPLHVVGAFLAIGGGNTASLAMSLIDPRTKRKWMKVGVALSMIGIVCGGMLISALFRHQTYLPAAVWERGSVYAITAWEFLMAFVIIRKRGLQI